MYSSCSLPLSPELAVCLSFFQIRLTPQRVVNDLRSTNYYDTSVIFPDALITFRTLFCAPIACSFARLLNNRGLVNNPRLAQPAAKEFFHDSWGLTCVQLTRMQWVSLHSPRLDIVGMCCTCILNYKSYRGKIFNFKTIPLPFTFQGIYKTGGIKRNTLYTYCLSCL